MDEPQRRDRLPLLVFGGGVALILALAGWLAYSISSDPAPEPRKGPDLEALRDAARKLTESVTPRKAVEPAPAASSAPPGGQAALPAGRFAAQIPAGLTWTYAVAVEPPIWRDITLAYRTVGVASGLEVHTAFRHAGGTSNFNLGSLKPGDLAHANTRFPGFFIYSAYLPDNLAPGQSFAWNWAWQPRREGRVKRFQATVVGWEKVEVPAGMYDALRIEVVLSYIENNSVRGGTRETLWVAPKAKQIVKIIREGAAPDEGSKRIVAELAEVAK